jgi:hypothetical protein
MMVLLLLAADSAADEGLPAGIGRHSTAPRGEEPTWLPGLAAAAKKERPHHDQPTIPDGDPAARAGLSASTVAMIAGRAAELARQSAKT